MRVESWIFSASLATWEGGFGPPKYCWCFRNPANNHRLAGAKTWVNNGRFVSYQPQLIFSPDCWTINSMGDMWHVNWKNRPERAMTWHRKPLKHIQTLKYCWWFRNPANQLRLVVYPIMYRVLYIPGGAGFLKTINCTFIQFIRHDGNPKIGGLLWLFLQLSFLHHRLLFHVWYPPWN